MHVILSLDKVADCVTSEDTAEKELGISKVFFIIGPFHTIFIDFAGILDFMYAPIAANIGENMLKK
jgi:hypothetical protein